MSKIHVTIDRLALPEGTDRNAIVAALQSELHTVLADRAQRANWAKDHRTPILRLQGGTLEPGATGGRKFGTGMARAIGKGLKP